MSHNSPDFHHEAYPATPEELADVMRSTAQELDGVLDFAIELGEDSAARQLSSEQLQSHPLGARFDHVSVEYSIGDDPVDSTALMSTAVFVFQRFADSETGSIGISETVALTERGDGYTRGFVLMDEGGSLPAKGTSDPAAERAATQQSIDRIKEVIQSTDFTQLPPVAETDPGAVTRDNVNNISDALAIMHDAYPEMGLVSEEEDTAQGAAQRYANWNADPSSDPEFSAPADAFTGRAVRLVASHILAAEQSTSHVFSEAALAAVGGNHPVVRAVMHDRGEEGLVIIETRLTSTPESDIQAAINAFETLEALPPEALPDNDDSIQSLLEIDSEIARVQYEERTHTIMPDGTVIGSLIVHYPDGSRQTFDPENNPTLKGECSGIHLMLRADLQVDL